MEKRDGLRMLRWRKMTGSVMGWNGALLYSLPGCIIICTLISASFRSCCGVWTLPPLTIYLRPSLEAPPFRFIDLKMKQSHYDPLPVLLSNSLLCTSSFSHAASWSVWVEGWGCASEIWFYQWLSESLFWCGVSQTGGGQLLGFKMCSQELFCFKL